MRNDDHRAIAIGGGAFRSLTSRSFRLWFVGQGISTIGYFAQTIALAVLVLDLTDNGTAVGLVTSMYFLPVLVVGPWAGMFCDRWDKRRLLLVTQTSMMLCAFALAALSFSGSATYLNTLALAALTGIAGAFDQPARRTIVTELVPETEAANAVALNGSLSQAAKVLGPALAAALVSTAGVASCFVVNGLTSVAVLVALVLMGPHATRPPMLESARMSDVADTFRYAWSDRDARLLLCILGVTATLSFNWVVLLPLLVEREYNSSSGVFAALMAVMSLGSLAGAMWVARQPVLNIRSLSWWGMLFGASSIGLAVTPTPAAAGMVAIVVGFLSMVLVSAATVSLQLGSPLAMRGRMMAVFSMVVIGGHAIGGILAGLVGEQFGARPAIAGGGLASIVIGLVTHVARRTDEEMASGTESTGPSSGEYAVPTPNGRADAPLRLPTTLPPEI